MEHIAQKNTIVIFGASGFIGGHLFSFYGKKGIAVTGTYFSGKNREMYFHDLSETPEKIDFIPQSCRHAIISSGIANVDYNKTHKDKCQKINVLGTKLLIDSLLERRITPLFLSTDYVFEGTRGSYRETDTTVPTTAYGRNKVAVEEYLKKSGGEHLIVRLGKICGVEPGDGSLLTEMTEKLISGEEILCAHDQILSPTSILDVIAGISKLIEIEARGVFHLSSPEIMSRYELAAMIRKKIPHCMGKIKKCRINDLKFAEKRPLNTTLNSEKLAKLSLFTYHTVEDGLRQIISERPV